MSAADATKPENSPSLRKEILKPTPVIMRSTPTAAENHLSDLLFLSFISAQTPPFMKPPTNAVRVNRGLYAPMGLIIQPSISDEADAAAPNSGPYSMAGMDVNTPEKPTVMPEPPNMGISKRNSFVIATQASITAVTARRTVASRREIGTVFGSFTPLIIRYTPKAARRTRIISVMRSGAPVR